MKFGHFVCASAVLALAACGNGGNSPAVTQTVIRETVTVSPTPPPTKAEPLASESTEPSQDAPQPQPAPQTFTMPRLVGKNLQLAQDTLQSLDSYILDQEDASGLGRIQVNDSNWTVCTQSPKAGTKVSVDTTVVLSSVKLNESCP